VNLTARNIHLTDQILAFLAAESPLPASTPAIHAALTSCDGWPHTACWDRHVDYAAVLRMLNRLAKRGEVEKWEPREAGRACCWRRLSLPEEP
jgi:hypothetical protein